MILFSNEFELICSHTSIAIISRQLNELNYCYQIIITLFNINHLFAGSKVVTSIAI